jgi:hypothetical protein
VAVRASKPNIPKWSTMTEHDGGMALPRCTELVMEIPASDGTLLHFHADCFVLWDEIRRHTAAQIAWVARAGRSMPVT